MAKMSIIIKGVLEVMIREPEGFNPVTNFVSRVLDREQRWSNRLCSFTSQGIFIYKPGKIPLATEKPDKVLHFEDCWQLQKNPRTPDGRHLILGFRLQSTGKGEYYFICESEESLSRWTAAFIDLSGMATALWQDAREHDAVSSNAPSSRPSASAYNSPAGRGYLERSIAMTGSPAIGAMGLSDAMGSPTRFRSGRRAEGGEASFLGRSLFRGAAITAASSSPAIGGAGLGLSLLGSVLGTVQGKIEGYMSEVKDALSMNFDSDESATDTDDEGEAQRLKRERATADKVLLKHIESEDMRLLQRVGLEAPRGKRQALQQALAEEPRKTRSNRELRATSDRTAASHSPENDRRQPSWSAGDHGGAVGADASHHQHAATPLHTGEHNDERASLGAVSSRAGGWSRTDEEVWKDADGGESQSERDSVLRLSPHGTFVERSDQESACDGWSSVYEGGEGSRQDPRWQVLQQRREVHAKMNKLLDGVEDRCRQCGERIKDMVEQMDEMEEWDVQMCARLQSFMQRDAAAADRVEGIVRGTPEGGEEVWGGLTGEMKFLEGDAGGVSKGIRHVQDKTEAITKTILAAREMRVALQHEVAARQPPRTLSMAAKEALYMLLLFLLRTMLWVFVPPLLLLRKGYLLLFQRINSKKLEQWGGQTGDKRSRGHSSLQGGGGGGAFASPPDSVVLLSPRTGAAPLIGTVAKDQSARRKLEMMRSERQSNVHKRASGHVTAVSSARGLPAGTAAPVKVRQRSLSIDFGGDKGGAPDMQELDELSERNFLRMPPEFASALQALDGSDEESPESRTKMARMLGHAQGRFPGS